MASELSVLGTGRFCRSTFRYGFGRKAERVQTFLSRILPLFNSGAAQVVLGKMDWWGLLSLILSNRLAPQAQWGLFSLPLAVPLPSNSSGLFHRTAKRRA